MTVVKIPIYSELSYLPIYLEGTEDVDQDVQVTVLKLNTESLAIPTSLVIPNDFLQPVNANNERKLKTSDRVFDKTFDFPARTIQIESLRLTISWKTLRLRVHIPIGSGSPEIRLEIFHMRLSSPLVPSIVLDGDLGLVFDSNSLNIEQSYFKRYEPDANNLIPLDFKNFKSNNQVFALKWNDPHINYWLRCLSGNFSDKSARIDSDVSLRIVRGNPAREIRLDWKISGEPRTFSLPGLQVNLPIESRLSLVLSAENNQESINILTFIVALNKDTELTAKSNFAWERDEDRELQNDDDKNTDKSDQYSLFKVKFSTKQNVTLILLKLKLDEIKLPEFFRQLDGDWTELNFSDSNLLTNPQTVDTYPTTSLKPEFWDVDFDFNAEKFKLPFLKENNDDPENGVFPQVIQISKIEPDVDIPNTTINLAAPVTVNIGTISLNTQFNAQFNWETFAIKVTHEEGIKLLSKNHSSPRRAQNI